MAQNLQPEDFHIGWICAVQAEYVVACELLDKEYPTLFVKSAHDNNTYTFGRVSQHNVVIACLPKGKYGLTSAASVAKDMLRSFPSIRLGLMVGIAGGAPSKKHDIRLGDVVVSSPTGKSGGVIHYEFGKTIQNQRLERTGALNAPPMILLTALNTIGARHERKGHRIAETVQAMVDRNLRLRRKYGRPDAGMDRLYKSTFVHPDHEQSCEEMCEREAARLVQRNERATDEDDPVIHYGLIASADRLMKDAQMRDTLAREEGVLCFEMEAAGLMDNFPCVVIRGICDCSDTHKNDTWQGYAAATAAAYAKELLGVIQPTEMDHLLPITSRSRQTEFTSEYSGEVRFNDYEKVQNQRAKQPDEDEPNQFVHSGAGAQYNQAGRGTQNIVSGNQYFGRDQAYTADDIDRACLSALRCPDSLVVKNRLKENKDKLLHKSIEWIFNNKQYSSWHSSDDVSLLWIKGGAGKGKTMMSIGLIEELLRQSKHTTVVTYFFCQNADYELNTVEAMIKGLILRLIRQQDDLKKVLRDKWDTTSERFSEEVTSWRGLWNIFLEMLDSCKSSRIYVIVDALDECQDNGMANLLKLIVRTGLSRSSQLKWLLTSRPLDVAERELLAGSEQVMVSLELNAEHISQGVAAYISSKVAELENRHHYGRTLRRKLEEELVRKSGNTFLWVNLVCKELENVDRDQVMTTTRDLPPGLPAYYHRILTQLCEGELRVVTGCVRLLKVMMLTYRPLNVCEVSSVSGLSEEELSTDMLVNRCASLVNMRGKDIEFVHQSARDYLAGNIGQSVLNRHDQYGHGDIVMSCLSHLSRQLEVNLLHLPRPDATREEVKVLKGDNANNVLTSLDYAATLWVRHVAIVKHTTLVQNALADDGTISKFLHAKLVEWLECLSLLEKLPWAIGALQTLKDIVDTKSVLSMLVLDATRFLLRHYQTLSTWPLQTYSSAIIFSPLSSVVRRENMNKVPIWFNNIPQVEVGWTSLIQTLAGHSGWVTAVAFSPDGQQIASGSDDRTVKLWDASTGDLQKTLAGHSDLVRAVAFSPDGQQIASGSWDTTVKLWDASTGDLQKTLAGHSDVVTAVAFSPDGQQIASGSDDRTVKLWDASTGDLQKTLAGHSGWVTAVAFSPDGQQIASGSDDRTVKLWDASTGDLQKTLAGHSGWVTAVAFSPDGQQIASGSWDTTVKLWDASTGDLQKTLAGHSDVVRAVAFSPDGQQIVSGSWDTTVKLWDASTGDLQKTLAGHSDRVTAVAFSPDGQQIASGSDDTTVKLWDVAKYLKPSSWRRSTLGRLKKLRAWQSIETPRSVTSLKFSRDGRCLATNLGSIKIEKIITDRKIARVESFEDLHVSDQWIHDRAVRVLRLPADFQAYCCDVRDNQVTIGFANGRVLNFSIDRRRLHSELDAGFKQSTA